MGLTVGAAEGREEGGGVGTRGRYVGAREGSGLGKAVEGSKVG